MENENYFKVTETSVLDAISDDIIQTMTNNCSSANIIVTIPAHNEEEVIVNCLKAIYNQTTVGHNPLPKDEFEVIVMCHNCNDKTYEFCQKFATNYPDFNLVILQTSNTNVNNVGAVRRLLMNIAYQRLQDKRRFIAMTDADTLVDTYWIANLLGYLNCDYGLICGKIEIETTGLSPKMIDFLKLKNDYFSEVLKLEKALFIDDTNPHPRHCDNSGPNLTIRGTVYIKIGGIKPIGFCEDVALYDEVLFNGFSVRHCPYSKVTTSSRKNTRTPWGFGKELEIFETSKDIKFEVESLNGILARLHVQNLIKEFFKTDNLDLLQKLKTYTGLNNLIDNIVEKNSSEIAVRHHILKTLEKKTTWTKRFPKVSIFSAYDDLKTSI